MISRRDFLSAAAAIPAQGQTPAKRPPNVIFILADDLGYADPGCYGQRDIQTPNIDSLASDGLRFTQAYAGSSARPPAAAS